MTACDRQEKNLALYVEDDLDSRTKARLDEHIVECSRCRDLLARYRRSQGALHALGAEPLDELALRSVRERVRERLTTRYGERKRRAFTWTWAAASAAVVVAVFTVVLFWVRPAIQTAQVTPSAPAPSVAALDASPSRSTIQAMEVAKPARATRIRRVCPAPAEIARHAEPASLSVPRLSPEEADQLARAVVYVSRLQSLPPAIEPEEEDTRVTSARLIRLETQNPNVVICWLIDSNGG